MKSAHCLFLFAVASSSAFAGNVLVVGPLPTQIAQIQAAIDAAVDGDVILVKSGTYATFSIPNKELTIVADSGQTVNVDGAMRVRNLSADRTVVLSGMRATGRHDPVNVAIDNGFFATNCAGSIRVQGCILAGYLGFLGMPCPSVPGRGAQVENCADVAFVGCSMTGSSWVQLLAAMPGETAASRQGEGFRATGSSVAVYECTITGGSGGILCNGYDDGTDGGSGAVLHSSFLFAQRTIFAGGNGQSVLGLGIYAGWGGHGLVVADLTSRAHVLECSMQAGQGGTNLGCGFCGSCCDGEDGVPSAASGGTLEVLSGTARTLMGSYLARESTSVPLGLALPAGHIAALGIRRATDFAWKPAQFGVQLLSPAPTNFLILGTTPAFLTPSIPSADPGQTYHLQLSTFGSTTPHLGTPLSIAIVDSAY